MWQRPNLHADETAVTEVHIIQTALPWKWSYVDHFPGCVILWSCCLTLDLHSYTTQRWVFENVASCVTHRCLHWTSSRLGNSDETSWTFLSAFYRLVILMRKIFIAQMFWIKTELTLLACGCRQTMSEHNVRIQKRVVLLQTSTFNWLHGFFGGLFQLTENSTGTFLTSPLFHYLSVKSEQLFHCGTLYAY